MSVTKIQNGTGDGNLAKVDSKNRLHTRSTTETENHSINTHEEESYIVYTDITPTGAGSQFMYIKNTSDTKDMVIDWYRVWSGASAEAIDIIINPVGTVGTTTTITPNNANITSKNEAAGDFYESVGFTGLTNGATFDRLRMSGDGKDVLDEYPGGIIVKKGGVIVLEAVTGAIALEVTLSFYYRDPKD